MESLSVHEVVCAGKKSQWVVLVTQRCRPLRLGQVAAADALQVLSIHLERSDRHDSIALSGSNAASSVGDVLSVRMNV
ncbi:hypothetical protein [Cupriavidus oxalaticus]|uniref:Uncharacterized protein n=1 Tax=Cupriavidus oxalaticus TaxID=96344 RepID=A0A4P7LKC2_9BURK|nr:hypothetical protein [Cupriavidus oxalaticus]QBY55209.1 hypothetical protein E0W60_29295 [Cupriavidus oxalaticus]